MRRRLRDKRTSPTTVDWQERAQFFSLAATAMRRYRAARAKERRANRQAHDPMNMAAVRELLSRLETLDPRQARIVEMSYFGGLSIEQIAQALGLSDATVEREWTHGRAWLRLELSQGSS